KPGETKPAAQRRRSRWPRYSRNQPACSPPPAISSCFYCFISLVNVAQESPLGCSAGTGSGLGRGLDALQFEKGQCVGIALVGGALDAFHGAPVRLRQRRKAGVALELGVDDGKVDAVGDGQEQPIDLLAADDGDLLDVT